MGQITVLVADDHPVVRAGVRFVLQDRPQMVVIGEAGTGTDALEKVADLRSQVVLMDLEMPNLGGLEAIRRLSAEYPEVKVVVMSIHEEESCVASALKAGAVGYLAKTSLCDQLVSAIDLVCRGDVALTTSLLRGALDAIDGDSADGRSGGSPPGSRGQAARLTARETAVLEMLAEGKTNKEIGAGLFISPATAKKHVENILAKLHMGDRAGAAAAAVRLGLVK